MTRIIINTKDPGPTLAPELHGHFAEHLGHCIYEGIYVGEDSDIPNVRGLRTDVVEALKELEVPVLRWPGGCFADEYHWMDGIGPKDQRPSMVNSNWGGVVENNHFGTHEFMDLCETLGAEPYINGNLGSGTVREMQQWVEYLTCDDMHSPMAKLRAANGHPEPWKVRWFGVGNENWGCGGNMCPDYYSQEYRRYQTFVKHYGDNRIERIACGPSDADYQWTESLMRHAGRHMDHLTLHMYALDGPWHHKGRALGYDADGWYRLLDKGLRIEDLIRHHLAVMDRYDPEHRVGLIVDEWGSWHEVEEGTHPGFLYQQNAMRDAMLAAVTLDVFHRYADRITMANIAQTVNVLQAMILTDGDKMLKTPTYHVFAMYKDHKGAKLLDSWHDAGTLKRRVKPSPGEAADGAGERDLELPAISMTASKRTDGTLTVTISNLSAEEAQSLDLECSGAEGLDTLTVTDACILKGADGVLDDHNTFEEPERVKPVAFDDHRIEGDRLLIELPAASLVKLTLSPR